ncbi:DUF4043 family protein [Helicobacter sp. 11S02629-2]|uniref:DUF4043 family protein n=1 Tax=Helicobacter sp. 11S02629-2 TaxID=1476195 RepID=UPI000BA55BF0|nr:DUF4043 family protein [Helicobacter sp. 11S02629-2]PAF42751.1 hypothetical protein BKH40_07605 [Helicobacter sp. 11S02629-2]
MTETLLSNRPDVVVKLDPEIEKAYWRASLFNYYTGSGNDRMIRQIAVNDLSPIEIRLKAKSTGEGVRGNADLADNLDNMDIYAMSVTPDVFANAQKSPIMQYSKTLQINFEKEARENLIEWFQDKSDRMIIANLTAKLTNVLVCDKDKNTPFKVASTKDTVEDLIKKTVKGDIVTLKAVRELIKRAKNGIGISGKEDSFPIKPGRVSYFRDDGLAEQEQRRYTLFLSPEQAQQLKNDPEYQYYVRSITAGSFSNTFESGLMIGIDGCAVVELPTWSLLQAGLLHTGINLNSKTYLDPSVADFKLESYKPTQSNTDACIGLLVGASACLYPNSGNVTMRVELKDAGRKVLVGADKILGVRKAVFNAIKSGYDTDFIYDKKDFSVIGFVSSKE